jgi:hypothetical protein
MTNEERKEIVKRLLAEGRTLSEVQDYLYKEKGDSITYMGLRLLLSEMPDIKLPEKEPLKPASTTMPSSALDADVGPATKNSGLTAPQKAQETGGKLSISMDQIPQPGSVLSGFARFSSGAKAHWFLDEMGRLGLEPELGSEKPTQADMKEFSSELRRMLEQAGGSGLGM